jgi:hypothetical protein
MKVLGIPYTFQFKKMKKVIFFFGLFILLFFRTQNSYAQISRGAGDGELYITTSLFYMDSTNTEHWGLFHSIDNGKHLSLQYNSSKNGFISIGDPIAGKVYGCHGDTMWLSDNYGISWNKFHINVPGTSVISVGGNTPGEIYIEEEFKVFSSLDYGQTLTQVNDSLNYLQLDDVGVHSGTVYANNYSPQSYGPSIRISHDFGHTFSVQPLDSGFIALSRGAVDNELYLIRRNFDSIYHYQIFQSFNEGKTLIRRGTITTPFVGWLIYFTGGRNPGTFYAMRYTFDGISGKVCIDYSSDSAKTFTTNCYYLTNLLSINEMQSNQLSILSQNVPNPFIGKTSIKIDIKSNDLVNLRIYNLNGQQIRQLCNSKMQQGVHILLWDGKNDEGSDVSPGVYFYSLKVGNNTQETKRMILMR